MVYGLVDDTNVANLLYRFELITIIGIYSTQCRVVNIQSKRLIATSLSDGVGCTHSSCVGNVLDRFEFGTVNSVYSAQCRVVDIQSDGRLRQH